MTNSHDKQGAIPLQPVRASRRLSRRAFMERTVALGATGILAASLGGRSGFAAAPRRGGRLRVALAHGSTTDTLEPGALENAFQVAIAEAIADTLTEVGPDQKLQPALAESWESTPDAKQWTFKLRKQVEFQNGKTLTAADVIASINHHRGKDSKSSVKPLAEPILDIKADGPNTVIFTLSTGSADFPYLMNSHAFVIFPATPDGGLDWKSGAGTGAYKLKSYDPGVRADLTRNPNYWRSDRGFFDEAEVLTVFDSAARMSALIANKVDLVDQVDLKTAHLLARRPGVTIEEIAGSLHYNFPMSMKVPPFNDSNVRLALKHAFDRNDMLQKIIFGHGTIGNDTPIGPSYRYYAKELEQTSHDPDKAKFYLRKSGLGSLKINLSAADAAFLGAVDAAVLYKESAAKAGIDINVVREPNDGYWANVWLKKPFCACYWAGYPTEDQIFSTGYASGAAWNDTQWDNATFDKLLVEARAELNEGKRWEMYVEMQRMLRDEGGQIVPMFANTVFARNTKVGHGAMTSDSGIDGGRFIERWWSTEA
jgi:peptide/nickel transport system substrate-binding protein